MTVIPGQDPWNRTRLVRHEPSDSSLPAPQILTDGSAPSVFDPKLEYSTEQVVLFWQPPSCFLQLSPSSSIVDDVSSSCAEQFMMAEKARPLQHRRAEELIMSSPDPSAHKCIGRGVRNLDNAVWDRVKTSSLLTTLPSSHRTRP